MMSKTKYDSFKTYAQIFTLAKCLSQQQLVNVIVNKESY